MNSVAEVIPYLTTDPQKPAVNLEVAMQALVLDERDPLALEITGEGCAKRFLLRACRPETVAHAEAQLRMRYPQAIFVPVTEQDDPLECQPGEAVSVIELTEGAAQYLPLQTWDEQTLRQPGIDPLLGVLGALRVSQGVRAVAQIAMVPAPPAWSKRQQRLALEHALDPEKAQRQGQMLQARQGAPSTLGVVLLAIFFFSLLLYQHFKLQMPPWVEGALRQLIHGQRPQLTLEQWHQVGIAAGAILLGMVLLIAVGHGLQRILGHPLYDQKLAAQKTLSMAYRVRIRLYVIGPIGAGHRPFWRTIWKALRRHQFRNEWKVLYKEREERQGRARYRELILRSLVAAYRQYHLARGSYFVPRRSGPWQTAKLFGQDRATRALQALIRHRAWKVFPLRLVGSGIEVMIVQKYTGTIIRNHAFARRGENQHRGHWHHFRPDALLSYVIGSSSYLAWLEYDRRTESREALSVKFQTYQTYMATQQWRRELLPRVPTLLIVVPDPARRLVMRQVVQETIESSALRVRITTMPQLQSVGPCAAIWQQVVPPMVGSDHRLTAFEVHFNKSQNREEIC